MLLLLNIINYQNYFFVINRCNLYSARIHSDGVLKALCIIITLALARRTPAHMAFQGINIPTRYPFTSPGLSAAQCG